MPDPEPVIIDGDTPTDPAPLTTDEALAAMRLMVTKLPADAPALADGLMQLAATAAGSPVEWIDLLRRELVRADQVMSDKATVYGEWQPVSEPRSEAETEADDKLVAEHNRIADEHGLVSCWSVDGADDLDALHPYPGASVLVHETLSGIAPGGMRVWGGDGGRFAVPIQGPRWLDLWIAADAAIQASGDLHHRFIETFTWRPVQPIELRLFCGS